MTARVIRCTVSVHHKTGVEMEALTGASIAALTIYDMCKALSHDIVISDMRLLSKAGGKSDYVARHYRERAGARGSPRFGLDPRRRHEFAHAARQGGIAIPGQEPARSRVRSRRPACEEVFVSVRASQASDPVRSHRPLIIDSVAGEGPIVGIRSALAARPDVAWLVLACDLPFLGDAALAHLLTMRDSDALATAYRSTHDGLPEPLCAVWEPKAAPALAAYQAAGGHCPRKFLMRNAARILEPLDRQALDNVNTPEEYAQALGLLELEAGGQTPCSSRSSTTP